MGPGDRDPGSGELRVKIQDMPFNNATIVRQAAGLLVAGFREHWPDAWPDPASGLEEVLAARGADRICRIAFGQNREVLGWIGGISEYAGNVWELHPLVVARAHQRKGIGRALVADFEQRVRERGGLTIILGTDDQDGMTTLSRVDLYSNIPRAIQSIQNTKGHPYEFYQRLGYVIVGVVPDANGRGKPDILMAKRIV
jgi:aminoglycoside 6'-N-acetyltransferase I